jgi:hypothetical protein
MKVIVLVFKFISKQYCRVKLHNMFINDNFDYIGSVKPSIVNSVVANSQLEGDVSVEFVEKIVTKKKSPVFGLNLCQFYWIKFKKCFKVRFNKKELFYKAAVENILRTFSVENIIKRAYDVQKLKYYLLSYEENLLLKNTKTIINSKSIKESNNEDKTLHFGYFSIINDDYS